VLFVIYSGHFKALIKMTLGKVCYSVFNTREHNVKVVSSNLRAFEAIVFKKLF